MNDASAQWSSDVVVEAMVGSKLRLIGDGYARNAKPRRSFLLRLAGAGLRVDLAGSFSAAACDLVADHLAPLLVPHLNFVDALIHFAPAPTTWNFENHGDAIRGIDWRIEGAGSGHVILHHDFMAVSDPGFREIRASGAPTRFLPALDELLTSIASRHAPEHRSLLLSATAIEREGRAWIFFGRAEARRRKLALHCRRGSGTTLLGESQLFLCSENGILRASRTPTTLPLSSKRNPNFVLGGVIHLLDREHIEGCRLRPQHVLPLFLRLAVPMPMASDKERLVPLARRMLMETGADLLELSCPSNDELWSIIETMTGPTQARVPAQSKKRR